ncbi:MAG: CCGSCS motif protein [Marinobacter sp.]|uniref:CCGSCS motif protein n=1 Tax=Marinobacter sp. TaxID=50741 RepID=UPI003F9ACD0D
MMQLFKEVISPKSANKANAEKLQGSAVEERAETPASTPESTPKKGKHGDPGVCCGGCS